MGKQKALCHSFLIVTDPLLRAGKHEKSSNNFSLTLQHGVYWYHELKQGGIYSCNVSRWQYYLPAWAPFTVFILQKNIYLFLWCRIYLCLLYSFLIWIKRANFKQSNTCFPSIKYKWTSSFLADWSKKDPLKAIWIVCEGSCPLQEIERCRKDKEIIVHIEWKPKRMLYNIKLYFVNMYICIYL